MIQGINYKDHLTTDSNSIRIIELKISLSWLPYFIFLLTMLAVNTDGVSESTGDEHVTIRHEGHMTRTSYVLSLYWLFEGGAVVVTIVDWQ